MPLGQVLDMLQMKTPAILLEVSLGEAMLLEKLILVGFGEAFEVRMNLRSDPFMVRLISIHANRESTEHTVAFILGINSNEWDPSTFMIL